MKNISVSNWQKCADHRVLCILALALLSRPPFPPPLSSLHGMCCQCTRNRPLGTNRARSACKLNVVTVNTRETQCSATLGVPLSHVHAKIGFVKDIESSHLGISGGRKEQERDPSNECLEVTECKLSHIPRTHEYPRAMSTIIYK